jgi:hypothetical protein
MTKARSKRVRGKLWWLKQCHQAAGTPWPMLSTSATTTVWQRTTPVSHCTTHSDGGSRQFVQEGLSHVVACDRIRNEASKEAAKAQVQKL